MPTVAFLPGRVPQGILNTGWRFTNTNFDKEYGLGIGRDQIIENIDKFVGKVEAVLKLPDATTFQRTELLSEAAFARQARQVVWVVPAPFWLSENMRHQFFTCVLRAAFDYTNSPTSSDQYFTPDDPQKDAAFWRVLMGNRYFVNTQDATRRFLFGKNHYRGSIVGWVRAFQDRDIKDLI